MSSEVRQWCEQVLSDAIIDEENDMFRGEWSVPLDDLGDVGSSTWPGPGCVGPQSNAVAKDRENSRRALARFLCRPVMCGTVQVSLAGDLVRFAGIWDAA